MRAYRTGDLGHYQMDICFWMDGLISNQLHGYRIEIGDIENYCMGFRTCAMRWSSRDEKQ